MNNGGMGAPAISGGRGSGGGLGGVAGWVSDLWDKFNIFGHMPKPIGGLFGGVSGALLEMVKDAIVGLLKKSGGGVRQRIVDFAKSQIGVPYLWGGTSPAGFDCSGLPYWAYKQAGKSIPRIPTYGGKQIGRGQIQPADIMFYYPNVVQAGERVPFGHFKMYAGNNQTVESASGGVQVRTADWAGAAQIRTYLGMGGITRGLAIAGEDGPEAVIPLTRPNRAAEVLAEAGLLGGTTIVKVYIDGREVTNRVVERIAMAKRRTARGVA
jgi:cell wall-associated NlpC family hydrolase